MRKAYCKGFFFFFFLSFPLSFLPSSLPSFSFLSSFLPFLPFNEQGLVGMHSVSNHASLARTQSYVVTAYNLFLHKTLPDKRSGKKARSFSVVKCCLIKERHSTIQLAKWVGQKTLRWDTPIITQNKLKSYNRRSGGKGRIITIFVFQACSWKFPPFEKDLPVLSTQAAVSTLYSS